MVEAEVEGRTSNVEGEGARLAWWRTNLAWAVPALLALGLRLANGPLTVDDAYITFRYARNVAEGAGFAYNPGEAVLGTTTPLWALVLAGMSWLTRIELPSLAWALNAAFDSASAALLVVLVRRLGGRAAAPAAALLFAGAPMSVAYAAGGMESSLLSLVLLLAGLAAMGGRSKMASAAAGLATLTRPEGVLAAALVLGEQTWRRRRLPLGEAAVYLAVLAPWLAFATLTFGSPLPQTMAAKSAAYQVEPLANALALALQPGLPGLSLFVLNSAAQASLALAAVALAMTACLWLFGARLAWELVRERAGTALALFPLGYVLAYSLAGLRGVRMFHWYVVPLVPFYCVALALAAQRLADSGLAGDYPALGHLAALRAAGRQGRRPLRADSGGSHNLVGPIAYALLALWWLPGYALLSPRPVMPQGFALDRERVYAEVALDYAAAWNSVTVVAAPEIGALGYFSRARILDTVGLVSPQAAGTPPLPREMLASDNAVSPVLIRSAQPDYVVSLDQFVSRSLLPDEWFAQHYRLVEARPAPIWNSRQLLVFQRI